MQVKLYSFQKKNSTDWKDVLKGQIIGLVELISNPKYHLVEIEDFLIKSFITYPLVNQKVNLRYYTDNIFTEIGPCHFQSLEDFKLSWNAFAKVTYLSIYRRSDFKEIYVAYDYNDSIIEYKKFDNKTKDLFELNERYTLLVATDNELAGETLQEIDFSFGKLSFIPNIKEQIFLSQEEGEVHWEKLPEEVIVTIVDTLENEIFRAATRSNSIKLTNIKKSLHPNGIFKLVVSTQNESITCLFSILYSSDELEALYQEL